MQVGEFKDIPIKHLTIGVVMIVGLAFIPMDVHGMKRRISYEPQNFSKKARAEEGEGKEESSAEEEEEESRAVEGEEEEESRAEEGEGKGGPEEDCIHMAVVSGWGLGFLAPYEYHTKSLQIKDVEGFNFQLLLQFYSLSKLNLQHTNTRDADLQHLPESITELDLGGTRITDSGLQVIAERCPQLTKLGLHCIQTTISDPALGRIPGNGLNAIVKNCPNLNSLDLHGTDITNAELEYFPESTTELDLGETHITKGGLRTLRVRCPKLAKLSLSYCPYLSTRGLKFLPESITELNVEGTEIRDIGLKDFLNSWPNLKTLVLSNTVTLDGREKIEEYFRSPEPSHNPQ